jgi:hypothetical protein
MNVFNVHVNRAPYAGKIEKIQYHKGKFLSANLDKASAENERNEVLIRTEDKRAVWVVQTCRSHRAPDRLLTSEGLYIQKGERFGLIRFGSRVEVFLPPDSTVVVRPGDKVRAGQTPLGYLSLIRNGVFATSASKRAFTFCRTFLQPPVYLWDFIRLSHRSRKSFFWRPRHFRLPAV